MIYAYDLAVQLPIGDLYNTQMRLAYISAAKDMYEKAALEMKDFKKEYGDFYSPIQKDMEWYGKNVTGRMLNVINDLYSRGIDPIRSAEGRAILHRELNNIDTATIALMKQAAAHRNAYNAAAMKDENYNKEFSDWVFSLKHKNISPDQWDTSTMGIFPEVAPARFKTLNDIVDPVIKNVDFTYDDSMTRLMNDGNDYYTITTDRMMKAFSESLPDIMNTPQGAWYYNQALTATNGDKDAAKALMIQQMTDRVSAAERVKKQADPFKKAEFESRLSRQTHAANAAIDHFYREQESENDFTRAIALEGVKNGNSYKDIFKEAAITAGKPGSGISGRAVTYEPDLQYYLKIDPKFLARNVIVQDENKNKRIAWDFNTNTLNNKNSLQRYNDDTKMFENIQIGNLPEGTRTIRFIPTGNMRATNGLYGANARISGEIFAILKDGTTKQIFTEDGYTDVWIPVIKRGGNYGLTQKKD